MQAHPLMTQQLARARQDDLRRAAEACRTPQTPDNDHPAKIRWIRRYVVVEETRCSPSTTPW